MVSDQELAFRLRSGAFGGNWGIRDEKRVGYPLLATTESPAIFRREYSDSLTHLQITLFQHRDPKNTDRYSRGLKDKKWLDEANVPFISAQTDAKHRHRAKILLALDT